MTMLEGLRNIFGGIVFTFGIVCCFVTFISDDLSAIKWGLLGVQLLIMALIVQVAQGQDQNHQD